MPTIFKEYSPSQNNFQCPPAAVIRFYSIYSTIWCSFPLISPLLSFVFTRLSAYPQNSQNVRIIKVL